MAIMRLPAVVQETGLSKATIWRRVRTGDFPLPVRLGGPQSRAVGWRSEEVEEWVESRE